MLNPTKPVKRSKNVRTAHFTTGPLRLTLEGHDDRAGEWLLAEFARANQRFARIPMLPVKKPWWRFW